MMYSSTAAFLPRQQLNCIEKPRGSETTIYIQSPEAKAIVRDMSKKPRISRCDWSKAESRDSFSVCLYNGLLKTTGGVSHQHLQLA